MTSRTFAFSRHRRRRTQQPRLSLVGAQDPAVPARPADAGSGPRGDDVAKAPSKPRDATSLPADAATHAPGARPSAPPLPHERDETTDEPGPPRHPIVRAERDLAEGHLDTDVRSRAAEVFDRAWRRSRGR